MKQKTLISAAAFLLTVFGAATAGADSAAAQTKTKEPIGMTRAREIAAARAAGKIEDSELEREDGKLVYSFDIRNDKGTITEVQVEAYTGEIVSVEEEDAAAEADEKRQDEKEQMKKGGDDDDDDEDGEETEAGKKANLEKYAAEAKITMEQAKEIALKRVSGVITDENLEKENGKLQYSFDVRDANGKVFDVEIDARTGQILKAIEDDDDDEDDDN